MDCQRYDDTALTQNQYRDDRGKKNHEAKGWEKEMNFDLNAQLRHWMISLTHCFYGILRSTRISHAQIIWLVERQLEHLGMVEALKRIGQEVGQ